MREIAAKITGKPHCCPPFLIVYIAPRIKQAIAVYFNNFFIVVEG